MNINKRKLVLAVGLGAMLLLAGCAEDGNSNAGKDLADSTGSDAATGQIGESYYYEVGVTEANQQNLVQARPPFQMDDSLERQNLIERYKHLNDRSNMHHVYLTSMDGDVMAYKVAQGKVSSVNSKLTNDNQIVRAKGCNWHSGSGGDEGACFKTVESPQMDGSYGTNGDAIFFFTPTGEYVEWNGWYLVSEEPMNIQTQVQLTERVDDNGTSPDASNATAAPQATG